MTGSGETSDRGGCAPARASDADRGETNAAARFSQESTKRPSEEVREAVDSPSVLTTVPSESTTKPAAETALQGQSSHTTNDTGAPTARLDEMELELPQEFVFVLVSNNGVEVPVERCVMEFCATLRDMMEFTAPEEPEEDGRLPKLVLEKVDGASLKLVAQWCAHHREDPEVHRPVDVENAYKTAHLVPEWDKKFLKLEIESLCALLDAASFLQVPLLMDYCAKTIANLIRGKTPAQIREILKQEDDFTPEEKAEMASPEFFERFFLQGVYESQKDD